MNDIYRHYLDTDKVEVERKLLYSDNDGFLNDIAFRNFAEHIDPNAEHKMNLICLNIDVSASNNSKGYAMGSRVLRKVYLQLKERFYIFRVNGDKFNIVVPNEHLEEAIYMLDSSSEYPEMFSIYYGVVDEPVSSCNYQQLRRIGKELMYHDKAVKSKKKLSDIRDDIIIGNKTNTPLEMQETDTRKFRATMWYGIIDFIDKSEAQLKKKLYVYPTEFKTDFALLNLVVVAENMDGYELFTGNSVKVSVDDMKYSVSARFAGDGHLVVSCRKYDNSFNPYIIGIDTYEGICIPAFFGKRISEGREIYPIRQHKNGICDFVVWDSTLNTGVINTNGILIENGTEYAVSVDDTSIELTVR